MSRSIIGCCYPCTTSSRYAGCDHTCIAVLIHLQKDCLGAVKKSRDLDFCRLYERVQELERGYEMERRRAYELENDNVQLRQQLHEAELELHKQGELLQDYSQQVNQMKAAATASHLTTNDPCLFFTKQFESHTQPTNGQSPADKVRETLLRNLVRDIEGISEDNCKAPIATIYSTVLLGCGQADVGF